jgi:dTDP-4-amino-4,6-dideoxygalactose transaminase
MRLPESESDKSHAEPRPNADRPAIAGGRPVRPADRFLVFGQPDIREAEIDAVVACLRRRWIGSGPVVQEFERAFAEYKGGGHAVAVSSGSAALHLALLTLGLGAGDEVITTAMTFCSTVNAILHVGATPVLADCDRSTLNIDPKEIERCVTPRTKAIVVVHLCGRCCAMDEIRDIADRHGLFIIEDCAHAIESTYKGRPAGLLGDVGCFSFYATKNVTTAEGGMLLTRDRALADRVQTLALHGMSKDAWRRFDDAGYQHYSVVEPGFKYNMTDLLAAIGVEQLKRIEEAAVRRAEIGQVYDRELEELPCQLPPAPDPGSRHAHHLYTLLLDLDRLTTTRDRVLSALGAEGIGGGVHYIPIHHHEYYRATFGWRDGQFPDAEFVGRRTMSLPLCPHMTDDDVADVCRAFVRVMRYFYA